MARIARTAALLTLTGFAALALAAPAGAAHAPHRDRGTGAKAAKVLPKRWAKRHKATSAKADPDHDGLSNWGEYRARTMPYRADSDRDGTRDDREDRDRDRLANGSEDDFGTDPRRRDSDGDGIRDGDENAGVVTAFDGTTLTIGLAVGGTLVAAVGDELGCDDPAVPDDDEDLDEDEEGSEITAFLAEEGDEDDPDDEEWDDAGLDDCGFEVAVGARVHQARIADGVLVELDLLTAE